MGQLIVVVRPVQEELNCGLLNCSGRLRRAWRASRSLDVTDSLWPMPHGQAIKSAKPVVVYNPPIGRV